MSSLLCIFCFKQKTAYELSISDWSSEVCSSDLQRSHIHPDADRYLTGRNTVVANGITQAIVQFAEQPRRIYGNIAALLEPGRGPRGWGSSGFARLKRENGRHPRQHQSHSGDEIDGAQIGQSHEDL